MFKELIENGIINEDAVVFENPDFDDAIIGVDSIGRLIYDYDLMVEILAEREGWDTIDAIEFIDYNTMRTLPYAGSMAPIIQTYRWKELDEI